MNGNAENRNRRKNGNDGIDDWGRFDFGFIADIRLLRFKHFTSINQIKRTSVPIFLKGFDEFRFALFDDDLSKLIVFCFDTITHFLSCELQ